MKVTVNKENVEIFSVSKTRNCCILSTSKWTLPVSEARKNHARAQLTKKKISSGDWYSILGHVGVQILMIATKLCDGIGLVNKE